MTTFKHPHGTTWRYDFWWKGRRYTGSTDQLTKADADLVESDIKKRLRQQAWGIAPVDITKTPRFSDWAEHFYEAQKKRVTRPDLVERTVRMVLAFFGAKPSRPVDGGVYHDLRLGDLIVDADWIVKFEDWMEVRGIAGATRNTYRSALSMMYKLANRPKWRKKTHITVNPIEGTERDPIVSRQATVEVDQLQAWILQSAPHIRIALAIGALAPKLRLASILALRWEKNFDRDLQFITNPTHKTIRATGKPQVATIDPQLRAILLPLRKKRGYVITFRGEPVKSIDTGLKRAAEDAGIDYGRHNVTFHTLRHTMATMLAELGVSDELHRLVMGHSDVRTTRGYTHARPIVERGPLAQLSAAMPLTDAVQGPVQGPAPRGSRKRSRKLKKAKARKAVDRGRNA